MATIEALRKSEQAFRALDECPETKEKLAILMKIEKYVLTDDPSYRCIESVLQNFLTLRHQESRPAPLRRYLAYFLEQVALRKSKMALRCVPACITLLEDPDSLTRQIVIQSARALQSRALLLIAKASTAQSSNVEAACQALSQLQERIWHILQYNVENANNEESTRIQNTPFHQACLFVAHQIIITTSSAVFVRPSIAVEQRGVASIEDIGANEFLPPATLTDKAGQRLQDLISLLDASLIGSQQLNKDPDHIVSLLEALSIIGRYRPQTLTKILEVFQRYANHDPWLDTLLSFHIRSFLACALDGDYHATCVHVLKKIDPSSAALPMENLIAVARQDQLRARAEEKINKLVKETLDLPFDGDTLLGTEQVVSASELVEADQSKYVEPYTLMTLRLNPKDAARICVSGIEKQLDSAKNFADSGSLRATKDLTAAAAAAGGGKGGAGGKPGTSVGIERKLITPESFLDEEGGEVVDPRARKRQKIKDSTKEQYLDTAVSKFEGSAASSEIQSLQQMVFGEVLAAKSRMQNSLQASCLADTSLRQFDAVNNRVISHLASFVEDPLLEEVFYGKAIGKALSGKNNETWQQDILPLFFAKYSSTVQRRMDAKQGANMRSLRNMLESVQDSEFTYGKLFQLFLRVYTTKFGGVTKKELREFLGSLPYLPESLFGKLENQCHVEGMPRKQALITCFYVAEKFPQSRAQAMRLLFKMAYTQNSPDGGPVISSSISDDSTSQTAIRFLAAKVYQPPATSSTSRSSGAGMLKRTSDGSMLTRSTTSSNNNSNKEGYVISLDALRSRDLEDMATLMLRSMVRYQRFDVPIEPSGYIRQIYEEITHHEHVVPEESRFWLFLAMSIKRPSLLTQLLEVYAIAEQASGNLEIIKKPYWSTSTRL
ncbi:unnamed protein product [Amoebophrya sp. A25]|nr:unnamed protein product [Amoebophrya sp. A25]|eukprot:GSA25T00004922001.1